jgi:hypothetical protein
MKTSVRIDVPGKIRNRNLQNTKKLYQPLSHDVDKENIILKSSGIGPLYLSNANTTLHLLSVFDLFAELLLLAVTVIKLEVAVVLAVVVILTHHKKPFVC